MVLHIAKTVNIKIIILWLFYWYLEVCVCVCLFWFGLIVTVNSSCCVEHNLRKMHMMVICLELCCVISSW